MRRRGRVEIYEILERDRFAWRWRLLAANGRIVAASRESFEDQASAQRNLRRTAELLASGPRLEVIEHEQGSVNRVGGAD